MVCRAALASFFVNAGYMALMLIAMYYGDNVLKGVIRPAWYYLAIIAVTLAVLYILIDREYVLTFNGTYQEATNLRLEIADQIKKLPLSYFSRHDLSDLAQTIMQDVTDLEHAMSHSIHRLCFFPDRNGSAPFGIQSAPGPGRFDSACSGTRAHALVAKGTEAMDREILLENARDNRGIPGGDRAAAGNQELSL